MIDEKLQIPMMTCKGCGLLCVLCGCGYCHSIECNKIRGDEWIGAFIELNKKDGK